MGTSHIVVDGSNIATEGRSLPSLQQLLEAVDAVANDQQPETVTVIVDATFGHRIDSSERESYDAKVSNGEIITPPAGVIGRGDAFILEVADRADAVVLSNDSFQEFHGEYRWLFDEGRLLGGKHVPGVGWIFLDRSPVRGPASRKATSAAKRKRKGEGDSKKSSKGPAKKGPSSKKAQSKGRDRSRASSKKQAKAKPKPESKGKDPDQYNDLLPFVNFVGANEVGSVVEGEVEQFSSHGAYVMVGETRCYIALKSLSDPPPRSARDVLTQGETRSFRVEAIDTPRRGIDLSLAEGPVTPPAASGSDEAATTTDHDTTPPAEGPVEPPAPPITEADLEDPNLSVSQRRKLRAAFAAQEAATEAAAAAPATGPSTPEANKMSSSQDSPAADGGGSSAPKRGASKPARKTSASKSTGSKRAAVKKSPAKKSTAKKSTAKKAPAKKASTKKATARKAPAKKSPAKKSPAKKSPANKTATTAKKASAKKTPAKRAPAKKASAKKASAKKTPAKKATARKAPAKKAGTKKAATRKSSPKRS